MDLKHISLWISPTHNSVTTQTSTINRTTSGRSLTELLNNLTAPERNAVYILANCIREHRAAYDIRTHGQTRTRSACQNQIMDGRR